MIPLYRNIRLLREQQNISQDELAKKTGYTSRSSIAKIESGLVDLPQPKIVAFANALNTTPAYLMGWNDIPELKKLSEEIAQKQELIGYYDKLNSAGKKKAVERVEELTEITKYQKDIQSDVK